MKIWESLSPSWQDALTSQRPRIEQIGKVLDGFTEINPSPENIFRALGDSPQNFRVVIVGQDPYPDKQFATGLAFSVPRKVTRIPPSLKNIQAEFAVDVGRTLGNDLSNWVSEGVLLLNRILTCTTGTSLSHKDLGWQEVTNQVISAVVTANPNTVAILWGNYANELADFFNPKLIISSVHPSPLSAHRGFFGSKPFSKANELLIQTNQQPINWSA